MAKCCGLKRVCFVIPTLEMGGTERQLVYLARGLAPDHEVTVYCTRREGHWGKVLRDAGVYVQVVRSFRVPGGYCPFQAATFSRLFRKHRPDILQTFLFGFDLPLNRAARNTGVPVVISTRRELATWQKPRHLAQQIRANELVDCVVANSRAVADFAIAREGLPAERVRVIYNGVDVAAFSSPKDGGEIRRRFKIPPAAQVIGMVANFSPVKDHELFLNAAAHLAQQKRNVHFLLVGEGPLRSAILRQARRLKLRRQLTLASTAEVSASWYAAMDLVVLCSRNEGFPNALLEAMAAGRPVVASAVGGIPELVEDGVTGQLITSRDPEHFANAMRDLLENPEKARNMGERATERACTMFSLEKMIAAYRDLYNELLVRSIRIGV